MKLIAKTLSIALLALPFAASAAYLNVDGSVTSTVGSTTTVGTSGSVQVVGAANPSGDVTVGAPVPTSVTVDVNGNATDNTQFETYASQVTASNANVSAVDLDSDGSVDVAYKHKGWLFGFIPVMVTSHTTVSSNTDGKAVAYVRLPWWSFFVSGVSKVQADAESSLNANADVQANAALQTSTDARMKLVNAVVSSLDAAASADASANASATTNSSY